MASIPTRQCVAGFVASEPKLSYTDQGDARLYVKLGVEHYRREPDQSIIKTATTFHDLVAFNQTAEQAYQVLAKDDVIIAEGTVRDYTHQRDGHPRQAQQFIATRLGHDLTRTRYRIDRPAAPVKTPALQPFQQAAPPTSSSGPDGIRM